MWDPILVCITHAKQGSQGSKDVKNPKRKLLKDVLQMFNEEEDFEGCAASVEHLVAPANTRGFSFYVQYFLLTPAMKLPDFLLEDEQCDLVLGGKKTLQLIQLNLHGDAFPLWVRTPSPAHR